jgi:hypothetical protein
MVSCWKRSIICYENFGYFKLVGNDTLGFAGLYHVLDGTISITYCDFTSKKISDIFQSSFLDLVNHDTITITSGKFSAQYK